MLKSKKIIKGLVPVIIFFIIPIVTVWYAFAVEPKRLVVERIDIDFNLSKTAGTLKLVQFSDTHLGAAFSLEQLQKAVDKINEEKADYVIFTGDLMDRAFSYTEQEEAVLILKKIEAKVLKIAIWGNHDIGGGGVRIYGQMMEEAGFTLLQNETIRMPLGQENEIVFTGLDDSLLGTPDLNAVPERNKEGDLHVLLNHEPDIVDDVNSSNIDLSLSGHSHGGQIKLPFVGPLVKVPLARKYNYGLYQLENGQLYVNTGLGTTKINARLFNPPQIVIFEIAPKS